jgi:hypothetical protein
MGLVKAFFLVLSFLITTSSYSNELDDFNGVKFGEALEQAKVKLSSKSGYTLDNGIISWNVTISKLYLTARAFYRDEKITDFNLSSPTEVIPKSECAELGSFISKEIEEKYDIATRGYFKSGNYGSIKYIYFWQFENSRNINLRVYFDPVFQEKGKGRCYLIIGYEDNDVSEETINTYNEINQSLSTHDSF